MHSADESDDIVPEGEESSDKIKKLRHDLSKALKERDEYLAGWQRAKADYINQKKEHEAKRGEFGAYADEAFFEDLLPVLDSFSMAFANRDAWEKAPKEWRVGVEYIHSQLVDALKRHHIMEYEPNVGEVLDPKLHEPVSSEPVKEKSADHTVMETIKKGYKMKDKILRPAQVKVGEYEGEK